MEMFPTFDSIEYDPKSDIPERSIIESNKERVHSILGMNLNLRHYMLVKRLRNFT